MGGRQPSEARHDDGAPGGYAGAAQDQDAEAGARHTPHIAHQAAMEPESVRRLLVPVMALLSFAALAAGLAIAYPLGPGEGSREGR